MMNPRLIFALLAGAWLLGACAQSRPRTDGISSETHFLRSCSSDSCGKGLTCVCGACTKTCEASSTCTSLAKDAVCAVSANDACDEGRTCDVKCKAKADCASLGDAYACNDGRCRAPAISSSKPEPLDAGPFTGDASGWFLSQSEVDALWACQNRSVEACAVDGRCAVINAERYDDRQACFGEQQPAVCYPADWGGDGALGCLIDPDGVRWRFGMGVKLLNWKQDPERIMCGTSLYKCADAGGSGPGKVDCQIDAIANSLLPSQSTDCGTLPISPSTAARTDALDCVRSALDSQSPFRVIWQVQGIDSIVKHGLAGVSQGGALVLYGLSYDGQGSPSSGDNTSWSPCETFSWRDGCSGELGTCFECQSSARSCTCTDSTGNGTGTIECGGTAPDAGTVIQPSSCADNACQFDGVCYPDQTSTEDGCCTCDKQGGGGGCIEPAWCPGWVLIGKRCSNDADCSLQAGGSSGLHCRTDSIGGVCTRDCNFGCPTGTECVAALPDDNGGTIKNVCMRKCTEGADCAMEPRGNALGSTCGSPNAADAPLFCL